MELQNEIMETLVGHFHDTYPEKEVWVAVAEGNPTDDQNLPAMQLISFTAQIFFEEDTEKNELKKMAEEYMEWITKESIAYPTKAYFYIVSDQQFKNLDEMNGPVLVNNGEHSHCVRIEAEDSKKPYIY